MSADALEQFATYFDTMLADLSPAKRKAVARKIGQRLRRLNAQRMRANVEPDGAAMAPRKKRLREKSKPGRGRRMFREIGKARNLRVRPSEDGVEIGFANPGTGRVAVEHHFGLDGRVGRTRAGRMIRTRYTARRLLGFGAQDIDAVTDELLAWLDRG